MARRDRSEARTWVVVVAGAVGFGVFGALGSASIVPARAQTAIAPSTTRTPVWGVEVVRRLPHDPTAFSQGLVVDDRGPAGQLIEGTGLEGKSEIRRVDLATGKVLSRRKLPTEVFGEGITLIGDRVYQLTWQDNVGYVSDRASLKQLGTFAYPTEGWGLADDGKVIWLTDGTPNLYTHDPKTFRRLGQVPVVDPETGRGVDKLNEAEWVKGEVWANVWLTDRIARIDPATGAVVGWIDLTGLRPADTLTNANAVANGIAWDSKRDRLYVTGKLWNVLYEVRLTRPR